MAVFGQMKYVLVVVAPGEQMIKTALDLNAKFPCHIVANDGRNIAELQRYTGFSRRKRLVPMNENKLEIRLSPEDRELANKKAELDSLEARLAQRELELLTLEVELREFEQLYLQRVGTLYAQLDEIKARIAESEAAAAPEDDKARNKAKEARAQAEESARTTESIKDDEPKEKFKPSDSLKKLYRELARQLHPDLVLDEQEKAKRHELMAKANAAYEAGDEALLTQMLADQLNSPDEIKGDGLGAELIRVIRQIARAEERLRQIDIEFKSLMESDLFELKSQVADALIEGRDLLAELADVAMSEIEIYTSRLEEAT